MHHSLPHPNKKNSFWHWYAGTIAVAILILAGWWVYRNSIPKTLTAIDPETTPQFQNFDPETPPPGFPNVFIEDDAQWLRSSNSTYPNGKTAATRIYRTAFSPQIVYQHYLNSLWDWVMDDYQSLGNGVYLIAARGRGGALMINIEPTSGNQSKVVATFVKDH